MKLKQELPWFPFYCNDFLADTRNMTAEEIGGYIQLVATYWVNGPIVNKPEVVNKIAGMDASLIVDMFFEVDSNGKLFSPYFAELKEAAILSAEKERARTRKASAARWPRDGHVTGNSSVTETDTDTDTETKSDSHSEVESETDLPRPSVTERFQERFGSGSPKNGTARPPSLGGTPQTSVTDATRTNSKAAPKFEVSLVGGKTAYVTPETIANWKEQYPSSNVEAIVRYWSNASRTKPFDGEDDVNATLIHYIKKAHENMTKRAA